MNENTVNQVQIDNLFKAGAHFGFSKSRRHPSMEDYIFGVKNKVEIFDLEKVALQLAEAKNFMHALGKKRQKVLFVSSKNEARGVIKASATSIDMPYVAGRWIGGTLTNFSEIKKRIARLVDLTTKRDKGELNKYTKLERLHIDREIEELDDTFGGLVGMDGLPHALFVVDTKHEEIAVTEAHKVNIPVVGILNSDCNAADATHYIPANDSGVASIKYILQELVASYEEGLKEAPAPEAVPKKKENNKK
jgi:small subunit ribosomal protein S2